MADCIGAVCAGEALWREEGRVEAYRSEGKQLPQEDRPSEQGHLSSPLILFLITTSILVRLILRN